MKRIAILLGAAMLLSGPALAGGIDPDLEMVLEQARPGEMVSALIYLPEQLDARAITNHLDGRRATLAERHAVVYDALQDLAQQTQGRLIADLGALKAQGDVQDFQAFFVANVIRVDASEAAIRQLADHRDVEWVYYNYPIEMVDPVSIKPDGLTDGGRLIEPGVEAVRAPEVWAMGIDGTGVLVSTLDTGVDGSHPALASRWRGLDPAYAGHPEWAFFDPVTGWTFPQDSGSHGTHTMGSVCGGLPGDQIGVAPGAQWIHAAVIDRIDIPTTIADALAAFEWLLNPDGDPGTHWDVPDVCSNSWGIGTWHSSGAPYNIPCNDGFWAYLDNCEAAGIVVLFSAGNEGPTADSLRRPADRASTDYDSCAVGSVNANITGWPISGFSSRGPSYCTPTGDPAIKPDISAPGEDVRSSVPGGGYSVYSGTSMASPHVNGVVALMRQACPDLTPMQIKQIIYDTAFDLGATGEDNDYGWGMVDALMAVQMATAMCGPTPPWAFDGYWETPNATAVDIALNAIDPDGQPDPPGALTFIVTTLPEHGALIEPGVGEILSVPHSLADYSNLVTYDPDPWYNGPDSFTFKANDGGVPPDGGDSEIATIYITVGVPEPIYVFNFDTDPGWSVEGEWEFGQPTGQGGTSWGNPDPTSGATGSNVYGINLNGDYSIAVGGPYLLTTNAIDCSDLTEVELHFQRWLNTDYPNYVFATIEVSNNGSTWTPVWQNSPGVFIHDSMWSEYVYDISAVADNQATVYLRWGHEVGQTGAFEHSGWNIDDVEIWGVQPVGAPCPADINLDGVVNVEDLLILLGNWGGSGDGDINEDGIVDVQDLLLLLADWGPCPV